jgi:hypothetical protein
MEIREEAQAVALRELAELGAARAAALAEAKRLQEPLREAALRAVHAGVDRKRVHELARVASHTLYGWLQDAGIPIRPKKSVKGAGGQGPNS